MRNKPSVVDKSEILHKIEYLISQTDISCSQDQLDKMATLVVLLEKWNKALNLTAIRILCRWLYCIFWIALLFLL